MADYEVFIKENAQVKNVDKSTCDDKKTGFKHGECIQILAKKY